MMSSTYLVSVLGFLTLLGFVNGAAFLALEDDIDVVATDDIEIYLQSLQRNRRVAIFGSGDDDDGGSGNSDSMNNETNVISTTLPETPQVIKFHVQSRITGRYASTVIISKLHNWQNVSKEVEFPLTLPEEAFISDFFMIVGGTIYRSEVKEKKEAQKKYDKAKKKGQTAGQVKQKSPKASEFGISVNLAANSSVTFNLTYEQLLSRRFGIIQQKIGSVPGQVVDNYKVDIYLTETQPIKFAEAGWLHKHSSTQVFSPSLSTDDVTEHYTTQYSAHFSFQPSLELQISSGGSNIGFNGDVYLQYDTSHDLTAGNLQVMNGYFVHYFSPEGLQPVRKNVVFVIDVSGSMEGSGKMDYTKDALNVILDDMRAGDTFNIVTFETFVHVWSDTMLNVTNENVQRAKEFVNEMVPLVSTNLHGGVMKAIEFLRQNGTNNDAYPMIIMLTDGQPTAGIFETGNIRQLVRQEIQGDISLFTLGFGSDVDSGFLELLALENQGSYRKIFVDASASLQLQGFYDEVATPLLHNIDIQYEDNAIDINSVTQTNFISYFKGTELVVAGKMNNDIEVLSASVLASSRLDNELEMTVFTNTLDAPKVLSNRHAIANFAQKLWAFKTIKLLLNDMKIATSEIERQPLRDRALDLSLKYRFVTPLTSLVVVQPDEEDEVEEEASTIDDIHEVPLDNSGATTSGSKKQNKGRPGGRKKTSSGSRSGGGGGGGYADSDPHFLIHIPANDLSICFDINGHHGDVYNLLTDENVGIRIHGSIVSASKPTPGNKHTRTYFGSMTLYLNSHTVSLTPSQISIDDDLILQWDNPITVSMSNNGMTSSYGVTRSYRISVTDRSYRISVTDRRKVILYNDAGIRLVFVLHRVKDKHEFKVDHLGFYVDDGEGLSTGVYGLIGQFQYKSMPVIPGSIRISKDHQVTAELRVHNKSVNVLKRSRKNALTKTHQSCWFRGKNGEGFINGHHSDYLIR